MERLSPHLTVAEFLATSHREFVTEQERVWYGSRVLQAEARRFAASVFEPIRALVGPIYVSSGFRCEALNKAVGGAQRSHHRLSLALDGTPMEMSVREALFLISHAMRRGELPFVDKAIDEFRGRWLHIQAAEVGTKPECVALSTADGVVFAEVA